MIAEALFVRKSGGTKKMVNNRLSDYKLFNYLFKGVKYAKLFL